MIAGSPEILAGFPVEQVEGRREWLGCCEDMISSTTVPQLLEGAALDLWRFLECAPRAAVLESVSIARHQHGGTQALSRGEDRKL
jgi:hypothetical protein